MQGVTPCIYGMCGTVEWTRQIKSRVCICSLIMSNPALSNMYQTWSCRGKKEEAILTI